MFLQVAPHHARFVIPFLAMRPADEDELEVALPVEIDGMIEARLKRGRWRSVEFDFAAEHNGEIRAIQIIVQTCERYENRPEKGKKSEG